MENALKPICLNGIRLEGGGGGEPAVRDRWKPMIHTHGDNSLDSPSAKAFMVFQLAMHTKRFCVVLD